ncbi:MAG: molybdopterin molybdotransferase MoeA [Aquificae bacterium]|nr:molybdopterin molybdotransferase MoeA [Aquificota bacterium]
MLDYQEALKLVLDNTKVLGNEKVFLADSLFRILAEDILADRDNPPFDNSGMDGFAVRYEDIKGASKENPAILKIKGEIKAGGSQVEVTKGTAVSIYTGAVIPKGADTVIQKELVKVEEDRLIISQELPKGANIRTKGDDYKKGQILIEKGTLIRPPEIGIMASVNKPTVYVKQKLKVGILTTGDEILDIGEPITSPSQIRTSNTYSLYAQIKQAGAEPIILGFAKDNPEDLTEKLSYAKTCDVLLTTGGVSVGEYDLVKDFVSKVLGVKTIFWKIAQKPGKPVVFGTWGTENQKLFFGIPGNPVASMVVFETLVKPAIKKMMGFEKVHNPKIKAKLKTGYKRKKGDRLEFIRVKVEKTDNCFFAEVTGKQGSNILTSMLKANGLGIVPKGTTQIPKNAEIEVILFDTYFLNE